MELFRRKKKGRYPEIQTDRYEPVLRCSICTGEQVLCSKDRKTGQLTELMLIRKPSDLFDFCNANGICLRDKKDGSVHELMLIRSAEELRTVCEINNIAPEAVKRIY